MPSVRVDITAEVVKTATDLAKKAKDSETISDWFDIRQHYLQLRQRGKQVTWYVRARGRSQRIGVANAIRGDYDRDLLSIKQARDRAAEVYAGIEAPPKKVSAGDPSPAWTWSDLDREYQASLTEPRWRAGRVKPPSKGTQDDVRLAFAKPPVAAFAPTLLPALTSLDLTRAIEKVHAENGHRAACKTLAYVKSALTWALSKRGEKSGLHGTMPWWSALRPPDPTSEEIVEMQARRRTLTQAKVAFGVDHLGALLVEHESFCTTENISPGIRWGLWWVAFTGNRRFSTVALERERLLQVDEFGRDGWGRAAWPPEMMKGKSEFWLPLPPAVRAIANGSIEDWTAQIRRSHGEIDSKWVFASTRRHGRDPENDDVAVYPNSLNAHLRAMRGVKKSGRNKDNKLAGLPWFSLHLVRSVAGNYLDAAPGVPKVGISAMLAHADEETDDRLAPTTKAFYVSNQRMPEKAIAMEAWSEALIAAYLKAGGTMPTTKAKAHAAWARAAE
ncbi:hypothetical protein [Bradyrhizobium diazoefficiens]|uniref:hypothetical protein n=1 Tax=Bradyrhizobium diazoefficiens TaxID=1355477 RepID=UPI000576E78E|nr:hypothetical protein [Bradyrhizobium diazoefficiens]